MKSASLLLLLALAGPGFAAPSTAPAVAASTAPAAAAASPDPAALIKSARTRLDAEDVKGAFADADAAVAAGGGAAALAARADVKRAMGRAPEEAIADYAEAAKLDPSYAPTYRRLLEQATAPKGGKPKPGGMAGVPIGMVGGVSAAGVALLVCACFVMLRHRANPLRAEEPPGKQPSTGKTS